MKLFILRIMLLATGTARCAACYNNSSNQYFSNVTSCSRCACGIHSHGTEYTGSALCCKRNTSFTTFDSTNIPSLLVPLTILFAGESVQRGIFQDFIRLVSRDRIDLKVDRSVGKFGNFDCVFIDNSGKRSYSGSLSPQRNSRSVLALRVCFTFIGGLFRPDEISKHVKVSAGQRVTNAKYALDTLHYHVYAALGKVYLTIIGATVWDMLFVDNLRSYGRELEKVTELAKAQSSFVMLRTAVPLGYPTTDWQGTSRGISYHKRAIMYTNVVRQVAHKCAVEVLDMYDTFHKFAKQHPSVWEDRETCIKSHDRQRATCNKQLPQERKCVKFLSKPANCGNYVHISCSECDGNDGDGLLSAILTRGVGSFLNATIVSYLTASGD